MSARTIVVGDIHGCLEEFDELLKMVEYRRGTDTLILAGDLVDRGPDSHGVVRRAVEEKALAVMGNHDDKHVRYRRCAEREQREPGFRNPVSMSDFRKKTHDTLTAADLEYLSALPSFLRIGTDFIVVHGGLAPGAPEKQSVKEMVRRRWVDAEGKIVRLGKNHSVPEGAVFWTRFWTGPETVLYGHNVNDLNEVHEHFGWMDRTTKRLLAVGLDTGACFGGHLSAAIIEDEKSLVAYAQVKSDRKYVDYEIWQRNMPGEEDEVTIGTKE